MYKKSGILLFFTIFSFFAIFIPFGHMPSDTLYSIATADALCHGKLHIEKTSETPYAVEGRSGFYYSKYGIGYAAIFFPAVLLAEYFQHIVPIPRSRLLQGIAALTNTFLATACLLLFIILFRRMGFTKKVIILSAILIACGSMLLPYSKINHAEIATTLVILLFFIEWYNCKFLTIRTSLIAGACISLLLLLKAGNIITAFVLFACCFYYIVTKRSSKIAAMIVFLLPLCTALFLFLLNYYRFGTIFNSGYGAEQHQFTTTLTEGLWGLLFSPSKSLLLFSPLVILSIYGVVVASRSAKMFTFSIAALFMVNLIFYALWHDWHGGWSWGPRFLVPSLLMMHVFIPFFIRSAYASIYLHKDKSVLQWICACCFTIIVIPAIIINLLGALVWYQQMYYFHRNYSSVENAHPILASKLFFHKLNNAREIYQCAEFNRNCTAPPFSELWSDMVKDNSIDFSKFETFCGFSTFWGAMRYHTNSNAYLLIPIGLLCICMGGIVFFYKRSTPDRKIIELFGKY